MNDQQQSNQITPKAPQKKRLSPPQIDHLRPIRVPSKSPKLFSFFEETKPLATPQKNQSRNLGSNPLELKLFAISDLDQMQRDFCSSKDVSGSSLGPCAAKEIDFCTPKKTAQSGFKLEPKQIAREDPNRTKITPLSIFVKASTENKEDSALVEASSCEVLRLKIPPSYFFESQISSISPFEVPENPRIELQTRPAPVTINHNVVNSQPLQLNLDEIDTMSFEAECKTTQRVLNPNDITGMTKPFFPPKKSGKKNSIIKKDVTTMSFLGINLKTDNKLSLRSQGCKCDKFSSKKILTMRCSQGDRPKPFGSNMRRGKYISNRMKFEKQGRRGQRNKKKCLCLSQNEPSCSVNKKPLFVSDFLGAESRNIQIKNTKANNFGNLDLGIVKIKKGDFFKEI